MDTASTAGRGLTIVAIPKQDDYVWKISSEKVPHMTLLFLGEQTEETNLLGISSFLKHVATQTMCQFGMDVSRRGTLGEKEADVLFFGKYNVRDLETVRAHLLTNSDISKGYQSTQQFPEWIPHLTLGYPDKPAHPDERDYPGITWVVFDRVALWTDDYSGPEFVLPSDKYYSDSVRMGESSVDDILQHYGVKGMQWGVRRKSRRSSPGSTDHRSSRRILEKSRKEGVKSLSTKQLKSAADRLSAEQKFSQAVSSGSKFTRGHNAVKSVLAVGGTVTAAYALATSPAARAGIAAVVKAIR